MLSVGIGETTTSGLNAQCQIPFGMASGTSVLVVTVTILASTAVDLLYTGLSTDCA